MTPAAKRLSSFPGPQASLGLPGVFQGATCSRCGEPGQFGQISRRGQDSSLLSRFGFEGPQFVCSSCEVEIEEGEPWTTPDKPPEKSISGHPIMPEKPGGLVPQEMPEKSSGNNEKLPREVTAKLPPREDINNPLPERVLSAGTSPPEAPETRLCYHHAQPREDGRELHGAQQRQTFLEELIVFRRSPAKAGELIGISTTTAYRWISGYISSGIITHEGRNLYEPVAGKWDTHLRKAHHEIDKMERELLSETPSIIPPSKEPPQERVFDEAHEGHPNSRGVSREPPSTIAGKITGNPLSGHPIMPEKPGGPVPPRMPEKSPGAPTPRALPEKLQKLLPRAIQDFLPDPAPDLFRGTGRLESLTHAQAYTFQAGEERLHTKLDPTYSTDREIKLKNGTSYRQFRLADVKDRFGNKIPSILVRVFHNGRWVLSLPQTPITGMSGKEAEYHIRVILLNARDLISRKYGYQLALVKQNHPPHSSIPRHPITYKVRPGWWLHAPNGDVYGSDYSPGDGEPEYEIQGWNSMQKLQDVANVSEAFSEVRDNHSDLEFAVSMGFTAYNQNMQRTENNSQDIHRMHDTDLTLAKGFEALAEGFRAHVVNHGVVPSSSPPSSPPSPPHGIPGEDPEDDKSGGMFA